jgi:hypothetical protein
VSQRVAERASRFLGARTSRRGFLMRAAFTGTALAVAPASYVLKPVSAYAAICGCGGTSCDCGSACCDGWTEMCCTINRGMNKCPPGTFVGGWWRADGSSYCCSGGASAPRYYIDCQSECTRCTSGCTSGSFCSSGCTDTACTCANGSCGNRRAACNVFRYGQCHREIACSGPVACRVITCTPPYLLYPSCSSASATDNATANHVAPCLPGRCR